MYTLQNSKGEAVAVDARFRTLQNGKLSVIDEESFRKIMNNKYGANCRFRGLELKNANGDIATTDLGYNFAIDRMTYIRSKVVEQSFYEVPPADYIDVIVGEGAWAGDIVTNLTIQTGTKFENGNLNTGGHNSRQNVADASVAPFHTPTMPWEMGTEYSLMDVQMAAFSGNWNVVEMKQRARKTLWDLGIQKVAFLGLAENLASFPGLYSQPNVNSNTALIQKKISSMSVSEINTMVGGLVAAYLSNTNGTKYPNTFLIPQDDYVGLGSFVSETFPVVTKLEILQRAFDTVVPGGKVKIAPMAYGMAAHNKTVVNVGSGKARYVLYRKDIDTAFMEIPVDLTVTAAGTYNNFNFQDAGYGQYTGVSALKPLEILYFDY